MATETFNLIGADGEAAPAPPPQKFLPKREEFADPANDRARLRVAETQQLLRVCTGSMRWPDEGSMSQVSLCQDR